jgi:hypothetical protein
MTGPRRPARLRRCGRCRGHPRLVPVGHHQQGTPGGLADALNGLEHGALSYRLDPLAPAAARYNGSRTTRAAGWAASSPPAPGAASRGTRKHSPQPVGQLVRVDALGGGDGLHPSHRGPLPPSPRNTPAPGRGWDRRSGPPRAARWRRRPRDRGRPRSCQPSPGRPAPRASPATDLGSASGAPRRCHPGCDFPVEADGQLGRGQGSTTGSAGGRSEVDDLPARGLLERPVGRGMPSRSSWSPLTRHPAPAGAGGAWPRHRPARMRWWRGLRPRGCPPLGQRQAAPPELPRRAGSRRRRR